MEINHSLQVFFDRVVAFFWKRISKLFQRRPKVEPQELADRLHDAIQKGADKEVEALLKQGADPLLPYRRTRDNAIELAERWDLERPGRWNNIIRMLKKAAGR